MNSDTLVYVETAPDIAAKAKLPNGSPLGGNRPTTPVEVQDLRKGDWVDLESCPYLNGDGLAPWQYMIVDSIRWETPNCVVVSYDEGQIAGYRPDQILQVVRP